MTSTSGSDRAAWLQLSAGSALPDLVRQVLSISPLDAARPVTIAAPDRLQYLATTVQEFVGSRSSVLRPTSRLLSATLLVNADQWVEIDVSDRASRLTTVRIRDQLAGVRSVILTNQLLSASGDNHAIAIGAWAAFAHPKLRLGATLSADRDGLAAEIALAVDPALTLLAGTWRGFDLLVSTDDMIAAELAGLAIQQQNAGGDGEPAGPWEHPLVQRATELGLGVAVPSQIEGRAIWSGDPASAAAGAFRSFARDVFARIGVSLADED